MNGHFPNTTPMPCKYDTNALFPNTTPMPCGKQFKDNKQKALDALHNLPFAQGGSEPKVTSLNGWVFQQTIRSCLLEELNALNLSPAIEEEKSFGMGRARVDLLIGNKVAVELKAGGSFGSEDDKYRGYRTAINQKEWTYCYLSAEESHKPYRDATTNIFDKENTFFLDADGDWERFVNRVAALLKQP